MSLQQRSAPCTSRPWLSAWHSKAPARRQARIRASPVGGPIQEAIAEPGPGQRRIEIGWDSVKGPRPLQEDVVDVQDDFKAGFSFAGDESGGDDESGSGVPALEASAHDGSDEPWREVLRSRELVEGVRWPRRARRVFSEVFHDVDARLLDHLKDEYGGTTLGLSGATALVALLHQRRAIFASLGDCLAVVCRGGAGKRVSQQHRVYGFGPGVMEELERVESTGAWVMDGRLCNVLAVSRAFGDPEFKGKGLQTLLHEGARKGMWPQAFAEGHRFLSDPVIVEPDVTEVVFVDEDEFLILATDGLWDSVPIPEATSVVHDALRRGAGAQGAAEALVAHALRRHTSDNTSAVVVDLRPHGRRGGGAHGAKGDGSGGGWLGGIFGARG